MKKTIGKRLLSGVTAFLIAASYMVPTSLIGTAADEHALTEGETVRPVGYRGYGETDLATLLAGVNGKALGADLEETLENYQNMYLLGVAADFCIYLNGDFIIYDSDAEGRVAIAGNFVNKTPYGSYSIGKGDYGHETRLEDLLDNSGFAHAIIGGSMESEQEGLNAYLSDAYCTGGSTAFASSDEDKAEYGKKLVIQGHGTTYDDYVSFVTADNGEPFKTNHESVDSNGRIPKEDHAGEYPAIDSSETYFVDLLKFEDRFEFLNKRSEAMYEAGTDMVTDTETSYDAASKTFTFKYTGPETELESVFFNLSADEYYDYRDATTIKFEGIPNLPDGPRPVTDNDGENITWWKYSYIIVNVEAKANDDGRYHIVNPDNAISIATIISPKDGSPDIPIHKVTEDNKDNNNPGVSSLLYNFWNIKPTEELVLGGNFSGTIFAPNADVIDEWLLDNNKGHGHLSGALIANSFEGATEFGYRPFDGPATIAVEISGDYSFEFCKVDDTGAALAGATFGIYKVDEEGNTAKEAFKTAESGVDGKVLFEGLSAGTYVIKETIAPSGYKKSTEEIKITISDDGKVEKTVPTGKYSYEPKVYTLGTDVTEGDLGAGWLAVDPPETYTVGSMHDQSNAGDINKISVSVDSNWPRPAPKSMQIELINSSKGTIGTYNIDQYNPFTMSSLTEDVAEINLVIEPGDPAHQQTGWNPDVFTDFYPIITNIGVYKDSNDTPITLHKESDLQDWQDYIGVDLSETDEDGYIRITLLKTSPATKYYKVLDTTEPEGPYAKVGSTYVEADLNTKTSIDTKFSGKVITLKTEFNGATENKTYSALNPNLDGVYVVKDGEVEIKYTLVEAENELGVDLYKDGVKVDDPAAEGFSIQKPNNAEGYVVFKDGTALKPTFVLASSIQFPNDESDGEEVEVKFPVSVTKNWNDTGAPTGFRPDKVKVWVTIWRYQASGDKETTSVDVTDEYYEAAGLQEEDGAYYVELTADDEWAWSSGEILPAKLDGDPLAYSYYITVEEDVPPAYTASTKKADGTETNGTPSVTLTNTYYNGDTTLTGTKTWADANNATGERPSKADFESWIKVHRSGDPDGTYLTEGTDYTFSYDNEEDEDDYSFTITGLYDYVLIGGEVKGKFTYTLAEVIPEKYVGVYASSGKIEDNDYSFTNTLINDDELSVSVTKTWDHGNLADDDKATSAKIKIEIKQNGTPYTATLYNNGDNTYGIEYDEEGDYYYIETSGTWSISVPRFSTDMLTEYSYTIDAEELGVIGPNADYYVASVGEGNTATAAVINNKYEAIDLEIEKEWKNNGWTDEEAAYRATIPSITVKVVGKVGNTVVYPETSVTLTADATGAWKSTKSLPKYYKDGSEITYTVTEVPVPGYTTSGGTVTKVTDEETGEETGDIKAKFINTYKQESTNVSVTKVWAGEPVDAAGNTITAFREPITLLITIYQDDEPYGEDTVTLNGNEDVAWKWTSDNLPKIKDFATGDEYTYTVTAREISGPKAYTSSTKKADGTETNGTASVTLTNTYNNKTYELTKDKIWADANNATGVRPSKAVFKDWIKVKLAGTYLTEGVDYTFTYNSDDADDYSFTITGLHEYVIVNEKGTDVVKGPYTVDKYILEEVIPEDYEGVYEQSFDVDGNFVNTLINDDTCEISVEKTWNHSNLATDARPASAKIKIVVNRFDGTETTDITADLYNAQQADDIDYKILKDATDGYYYIELVGNAKWSIDLDKYSEDMSTEYSYTVTATEIVPMFYKADYGETNNTDTVVINNTTETTQITVTKIWAGDEEDTSARAAVRVTVTGTVDGEKVYERTNVQIRKADGNVWTATLSDLPKYTYAADGTPKEISYAITAETSKPSGYDSQLNPDGDKLAVKNTYVGGKTSFTVVKEWDDNEDEAGFRPDKVTVHVTITDSKKNKVYDQDVDIYASDDWTWTSDEYDLYENGDLNSPLTYSIEVTENDVPPAYTLTDITPDGNTVTVLNTYENEDAGTKFNVKKVWSDGADAHKDDSVIAKVTIINAIDESEVFSGNVTLDKDCNWTWTTEGMDLEFPTYTVGANGVEQSEYTITVTEVSVNGTAVKDSDYNVSYSNGQRKTNTETTSTSATITMTNTLKNTGSTEISITGSKTWIDGNDKWETRPDADDFISWIVVKYKGEDITDKVADNIEVDSDGKDDDGNDKWIITVTISDPEGEASDYTIEEAIPPDYTGATYIPSADGNDLVNTLDKSGKYDVSVTKEWQHGANANKPAETAKIAVVIYGTSGGKDYDVTSVYADKLSYDKDGKYYYITISGSDKKTIGDLPKYGYDANGKARVFTGYKVMATEKNVAKNYVASYSSKTAVKDITVYNIYTLKQEYTDITITKTWNDESNKWNTRPVTVDKFIAWVTLKQNGTVINIADYDYEIDGDTWTITVKDLPKFADDSKAYVYTIEENIPEDALYENTGSSKQSNYVFTLDNDLTYEDVKVCKIDDAGKPVEKAHLAIYTADKKTLIAEWWTDSTGEAVIEGLIAGREYVLVELDAPKGYIKAEDIYFVAGDDDIVKMTDARTFVRVIKVDGDDEKNTPLKGAQLEILDSDKKTVVIKAWVTGDSWTDIVGQLEAGKTYYIHEIEAPDGYKLSEEYVAFVAGEDVIVYFVNFKIEDDGDDNNDGDDDGDGDDNKDDGDDNNDDGDKDDGDDNNDGDDDGDGSIDDGADDNNVAGDEDDKDSGMDTDSDSNNKNQTGSQTESGAPQTGDGVNGMIPVALIAGAVITLVMRKKEEE